MSDLFYYIFTVDDEEVNCNSCDKADNDKYCSECCGAKHGWSGYERTGFYKIELRKEFEGSSENE